MKVGKRQRRKVGLGTMLVAAASVVALVGGTVAAVALRRRGRPMIDEVQSDIGA